MSIVRAAAEEERKKKEEEEKKRRAQNENAEYDSILEKIYHLLAEEDEWHPPMLAPADPYPIPMAPPIIPPWLSPLDPNLVPSWPTNKPINWPHQYPYPPRPPRGFGGHHLNRPIRNPWIPGNPWPKDFPPVQPPGFGGGGMFFGTMPHMYWLSDSGQIYVWNTDTGTWDVYGVDHTIGSPNYGTPLWQAPWWQFW